MKPIPRSQIGNLVKQNSIKLAKQIDSNNFMAVADTMNLICRTITNTDEFINDDFVTAIVKEVYGEFGGDQLVAAERGYPIDFTPMPKEKMNVTTACGGVIQVDSVKCGAPYSSEVFTQYFDYLTVNKQKTLPVTITQNDLRKVSCGVDTYNKLRDLILSKVTESIEAYIRDEIYCILNNPANYKKIEEITYTCDDCDGTGFIQALTQWALKLQINAKDYNLAGRNYDLPLKSKAWLLNSIGLSGRLASRYARGGTNASYIDISTKFNRVFDIPQLTIADGIIMDINWLQVRKVFTELVWKYEPAYRNECGVYNLDLKIKPINFFVAAPFKLIEISKDDKASADALDTKIQAYSTAVGITSEDDAHTQIEAIVNAFEKGDLVLSYEYKNYVAPVGETNGSIDVAVTMKNKAGAVVKVSTKTFALTLKQL